MIKTFRVMLAAVFSLSLGAAVEAAPPLLQFTPPQIRVSSPSLRLPSAPQPRLAPSPSLRPPQWETPRLGFDGRMLFGRGMEVVRVHRHSPASRLGLEPGDVIVRINNHSIESSRDYDHALRHSDGRVRLLVRNVRDNRLVWTRTVALDSGAGPVAPRVVVQPRPY